jgi:hypothetical protein
MSLTGTEAFYRVTTRERGPILASTDPSLLTSRLGKVYWEYRWGMKDWTSGGFDTEREAMDAGHREMCKARGLPDRRALVAHSKAKL